MTAPNQEKYPFEIVGEEFIKQYYATFETNRAALSEMYHPEGFITFEDKRASGREGISQILLSSLSFTTIQHLITKVDCQPTVEGGVMIMVTGRLQCDQDPAHAFSEVFYLRPEQGSYFILHHMFRLSLHNA